MAQMEAVVVIAFISGVGTGVAPGVVVIALSWLLVALTHSCELVMSYILGL